MTILGADASRLASSTIKSPAPPTIVSAPLSLDAGKQHFRWSDLDASIGYRGFVDNLRAIGCPETSIADIVRGNVDRAFSWERRRLGLNGSGNGAWSQASEVALINDLLGNTGARQVAIYSQNGSTILSGAMQADPRPRVDNTPQDDVSQGAPVSEPRSYYQNGQTQFSSSWLAQGGSWNANASLTAAGAVPANESSGGQGQQSDANGNSRQNSSSVSQLGSDPGSSPEQPSAPQTSPCGSNPGTSPNSQAPSNDPYTKSSQDIMAQQLQDYYSWYEPPRLWPTLPAGAFYV
ncbi:MAG TPA: hypothetical protein VGY56_22245 [Verrucomicrobiae bacterium]|nr:hypothetical protein [Verrucomicrobiae bacterium]